MTIVSVEPDRRVDIAVDFPARSTETATLSVVLVPADDGTDVTWSFDSSASFGEGGLGLLLNMEGRVRHDLDLGLAGLAEVVAAPARPS